ncbi:uncharacterized protein LOC142340858 [Convolutriloba macropyga]|uniref:uncharacterized protein LOC142340858 n=1 Tax=Convolutriloba macropyga TaxID=536237 RepID=UPI003F5288CB
MKRDAIATHYFGHGYTYQPIMPTHEPEEGEERDDLAIEYDQRDLLRDRNLTESINNVKSVAYKQCFKAIRPIYHLHNSFVGPDECCQNQCDNYLIHGYGRMFLTPQEYIAKLTNYSEENKTLNLIEAYFSFNCNQRRNIITKLGFGKGELVRTNYPFRHMPQRYGYPYLLSSSNDSAYWFPYSNPGKRLTYWWFKNNFICKDQPWICNVGEASTGGLPKRDANKGIDEAQLAEELLNKYKCTIC